MGFPKRHYSNFNKRKEDKADSAPRTSKEGGMKYGANKLQWSLFPFDAAEKIMEIVDHGARKYVPDNWKKVPVKWFKDAMMRHLKAYWSGEFWDDGPNGSGKSHISLAACNLLFIIWREQVEFGDPVHPPVSPEPECKKDL